MSCNIGIIVVQVAKQADAELEVQQLRETLEEYNKEFVDVKNQVRSATSSSRP